MGQLGRTTAMINALPDDGAIVVVPRETVCREVSRMIFDLRGPDFEQLCKVIVVRERHDTDRLHGARLPIVFDHTFDTFARAEVREYVRALARASNARFPSGSEYSAIN